MFALRFLTIIIVSELRRIFDYVQCAHVQKLFEILVGHLMNLITPFDTRAAGVGERNHPSIGGQLLPIYIGRKVGSAAYQINSRPAAYTWYAYQQVIITL